MSAWIIKAIEQKNPRLTVYLADSLPLIASDDTLDLGTREMIAGDFKYERN